MTTYSAPVSQHSPMRTRNALEAVEERAKEVEDTSFQATNARLDKIEEYTTQHSD
ncbi:hypothetical protein BDW68DRAFT_68649 [Aspergillus falconensis]